MLYYGAMSTEPKERSSHIAREDVDLDTQQIPLVNGSAKQSSEIESEQRARHDTNVPQETVPMPVPAWPSPPIIDAAPDKPPPLRRKDGVSNQPITTSTSRNPALAQRTGVLTGEL